MERPSQRPRVFFSGEGSSSGAQPVGDGAPPTGAPSGSASQVIVGRLVSVPDLLVRCWVPPGELSHRFLTLDTTLEPPYTPDTCTHVSLHFL